jgi:hypothetical protein
MFVGKDAANVTVCYPKLKVKTIVKKDNLKLTFQFLILIEDPIETPTECHAQKCRCKPGPLNPSSWTICCSRHSVMLSKETFATRKHV